VAILLVLTGTHQELYSYTMFATWIFLALTAVALVRLRTTESEMPRPFRVWGYPWTPLTFAAAAFVISANLWVIRPLRSSIGIAIILLGIPFLWHWRKRTGHSRAVESVSCDSVHDPADLTT
jgi:APA family basic amino acid/polyamine antiporter